MAQYSINMEQIKRLESGDLSEAEFRREALNLIETEYGIIIALANKVQELEDEINRLKGEKGKPEFKKGKAKMDTETTQDDELKKPKQKVNWKKGTKKDKIKIDRVETVCLDKDGLPDDIVFKGYEEKIIQNIIVETDNVLYRMEKYYSPSTRTTYRAQLDESLQDTSFGAETKALISTLYYENRVTENKIASFMNSNGLYISEGTISNILIKEQSERLTEIKNEIFEAGLSSSIYQQIDDTGMKIANKNGYATIICNERYSVFFINYSKSRETIRSFLTAVLLSLFIVLVCDDAPQFKELARRLALCWVHEERLYKKLTPILECHKEELRHVRGEIWEYYKRLLEYKKNPAESEKDKLSNEFDILFGQKTEYDDLNNRLTLTLAKKSELLTVLDFPEIPLHNNLSENGIREMVLKRKISGGVETTEGVKAWENNMSILATCKKLGVSFYRFMLGVFSKNITIDLPKLINS